jgi:hypothetical protein
MKKSGAINNIVVDNVRYEVSSGRGDKAIGIVVLVIMVTAVLFFFWIGAIVMNNSSVSESLPNLGTVNTFEAPNGLIELREKHGGEYYTPIDRDTMVLMGAGDVALGTVEVR